MARRPRTHTRIINGRHTLILYNITDLRHRNHKILDLHTCVYIPRWDFELVLNRIEGILTASPNVYERIVSRKWFNKLDPSIQRLLHERQLDHRFWTRDNKRRVHTLLRNSEMQFSQVCAYIFTHMNYRITIKSLIIRALRYGWL